MTEQEWLQTTDPQPMLELLRGKANDRKLRLFAVACWRRAGNWFVPREDREVFRKVAETAERFADDKATAKGLRAAAKVADAVLDLDYYEDYAAVMTALPDAWKAADQTALISRDFFGKLASDEAWTKGASDETQWAERLRAGVAEGREQACLLLEIFGNPFQPLPPKRGKQQWKDRFDAWLSWSDGMVVKMAQAIYDDRAFDRMPILADALEEAGCSDQDILRHCREPGEHVRGCWAVDLLLGKS
jgi:hypothetical protein